ncbi:hypothetical protein HHI36_001910 [Cryptolaemus montrouzieri]|uniref:Uncharacterized protein n=1 Tax=Cryptolaemus montrouzieri TaxID=559131 RepID=A0ABD2P9B8_9CUCU
MDSFTENILARARQRQKLLQNYATDDEGMHQKLCAKPENKDYESLLSEKTKREPTQSPQKMKIDEEVNPQSPKNSSFNITGSTKTNTLNINKENFNMEIKVTSSENVRVEVEFEEESSDIVNEKHLGLRKDVKNKLNRLGKLYAGDGAEISSPIHRTEETFLSDRNDNLNIKKTENKIPIGKGLKGLASLAEDINHWEDDVKVKKYADKDSKNLRSKLYGNISVPASAKLTSRPSMISENSIQDKINVFNVKQKTDSPKKQTFIDQDRKNSDDCTKTLHLDPTLLNTLESQGFLKKTEGVNLIYDFNVKQNKELDKKKNEVVETKENKISTRKLDKFPSKCPMKTSIADRAHRFEPTQLRSGTPEPSSLPLSERKALFEKNSGAALLPKAPFGFAVPISENNKQKPENPVKITSVSTSKAMVKETSNPLSPLKSSENTRNVKNIFRNKSPSKTFSKEKDPVQENNPFKSGTSQATGIVSTMAALMAQKNTISQAQIENKVKEERKQDMDLLLNRFKRKKEQVQEQILEEDDTDESDSLDISEETPINYQRRSGSKRHSVSPKVASVLEDVKKIKVSPAKSGRLYPNLSDIEAATETEHEDRSYSPSPNNSRCDIVIDWVLFLFCFI